MRDLRLEAEVIRYRRERWLTPEDARVVAALPPDRLLVRLHRRKDALLRVLERPEIPTHTATFDDEGLIASLRSQ